MSYCVAEKSHQTGDWDFWGRCWGLKQTNKIDRDIREHWYKHYVYYTMYTVHEHNYNKLN